jgi:hypothetical protein
MADLSRVEMFEAFQGFIFYRGDQSADIWCRLICSRLCLTPRLNNAPFVQGDKFENAFTRSHDMGLAFDSLSASSVLKTLNMKLQILRDMGLFRYLLLAMRQPYRLTVVIPIDCQDASPGYLSHYVGE